VLYPFLGPRVTVNHEVVCVNLRMYIRAAQHLSMPSQIKNRY
jgi:hypothetical protein